MVKITFLGGCREVGRSGVLIESEETGEAVLCDYGTKFDEKGQQFPKHVSGKDLSAIVLTHSHIDHSGALPLFYISGSVPLYTTRLTFEVTNILLEDMLRISSSYLPFEIEEINKMRRFSRFLKYGNRVKVGKDCWITLYDAGHIPGSAMAFVEIDGKKILYTGDINSTETKLLKGLDAKIIPSLDAIILETTYGTTVHTPREDMENELLKTIHETLNQKGITLIPAFGVGRSQEMMMILNKNGTVDYPVYIDGMARKVCKIYRKHLDMVKNGKLYTDALGHSTLVSKRDRGQERRNAVRSPGVIIAPSGMLRGGTARFYSESIISDEKNTIDLVSYQAEGTPGRVLLEKGVLIDRDPEDGMEVKAKVNHYDFSSHSGKTQLISLLNTLNFIGEKRVYCVHGDEEVIVEFANIINKLGFSAEVPIAGQSFTI